jgi:hypothetical protein
MSWFSDIEEGVRDLGKNLETNLQRTTKGLGLLAAGKWNNAGRTLFDMNPATMFMNPDDRDQLASSAGVGGQTAEARYTADAKQEAMYAEANDLQAERDELLRQASSTVAGLISARRRGSGVSFFGADGTAAGSTLLTFMG